MRHAIAVICALSITAVSATGCTSLETTESSDQAVEDSQAYTLDIASSVAGDVDAAFVKREVEAAISAFQREVAPLQAPIPIAVGSADCLRTGYNFETAKVVF